MSIDRPREHKKRDMWANIPWEKRTEIAKKVRNMPDGNEKLICSLAFIDGLSTTDIAYFCADNDIKSRNNRPYSRRRVQQIIAENVPEYNAYQKKGLKKNTRRTDHLHYFQTHEKRPCQFCGSTDRLEWHHMIPVHLGGTADDRNMICLCHDCHQEITRYERERFPQHFGRRKNNDPV